VRRTFGCVEATGLATARNRRPGSRAGAAGKAIVKHPGTPRRTKDGERTRTEATTRESGHGSPGRESSGGAAPGREPSETWRGGVGRRGRGSGRSSSHQTGERRSRIRGTNLTRDGPGRDNRSGGDEAQGLWRGPNPTREDRAAQHRTTKVRRGRPRGREDDEGGAPKPIGRYSTGTIKTLKGTDTSREWSTTRATAGSSERRTLESLERRTGGPRRDTS